MELLEYVHIIRRKLWILIVSTLVFAIISAVISFYFLKPEYQSDATIYISNKQSGAPMLTYTDLTVGGIIAKDYQQLIKSRLMCEAVINDLGLTDFTPQKLAGKLNIVIKNETRFISVRVLDNDPKLAANIANSVAITFKDKAMKLLNVQNIHVVDAALVSKNPTKPNKKLNIAIASFIGLMLGLGIIFIIDYFDDTIKDSVDIEKHLQLPILGNIPDYSGSPTH